jgi:AraC-like DNA-binding protein
VNTGSFEISSFVHFANWIDVAGSCQWGPRLLQDYELICIIEGQFTFSDSGCSYSLAPNDILCIPPNLEHVFRSETAGVISCVHFDPPTESKSRESAHQSKLCVKPEIVTKPSRPEFYVNLFREIAADFSGHNPSNYRNCCLLFRSLWAKLAGYWEKSDADPVSAKVRAMTDYIKRNLLRGVDRNSLAENFGYTPEYVNYLFKKELSLTPSRFITREKIFIAFDMIQNEAGTLAEIAEHLGFYDQYHFSKQFKNIFRRPPSSFKPQKPD